MNAVSKESLPARHHPRQEMEVLVALLRSFVAPDEAERGAFHLLSRSGSLKALLLAPEPEDAITRLGLPQCVHAALVRLGVTMRVLDRPLLEGRKEMGERADRKTKHLDRRRLAGQWLHNRRVALGKSQEEIAGLVGLPCPTFVDQIEAGIGAIDFCLVTEWAGALAFHPEEMARTLIHFYEPELSRALGA